MWKKLHVLVLQSGMDATSGSISTLLYDFIALRLLRVKIGSDKRPEHSTNGKSNSGHVLKTPAESSYC